MLGAAHKPGAIPLRPLTLGDMYDGAFRIIRFNPKATVGSAVLVAVVAMLLPVAVTAVLTFTVGVTFDATDSTPSTDDVAGLVAAYGALGLGGIVQALGLILVTGMVTQVAAAAALGRRIGLEEAWAATRGRRWRLVGLAALLSLVTIVAIAVYVVLWVVLLATAPNGAVLVWGLISVPAFAALMVWFWIRVYYLPVPAMMIENLGVIAALGRGFRLTSRQFWRTFGIALLTFVVAQVAAGIVSVPFSVGGEFGARAVDPEYALLVIVLSSALAQVVASAFVAPFTATVTALQYLDQRMRKEAYDVELLTQAGVLRS